MNRNAKQIISWVENAAIFCAFLGKFPNFDKYAGVKHLTNIMCVVDRWCGTLREITER